VGSLVSRELIRSGKPTTAVRPLADKRFLACMRSHVSFQVGTLEIVLAAAFELALEDSSPRVRLVLVLSRRVGSEEHERRANLRHLGGAGGREHDMSQRCLGRHLGGEERLRLDVRPGRVDGYESSSGEYDSLGVRDGDDGVVRLWGDGNVPLRRPRGAE